MDTSPGGYSNRVGGFTIAANRDTQKEGGFGEVHPSFFEFDAYILIF